MSVRDFTVYGIYYLHGKSKSAFVDWPVILWVEEFQKNGHNNKVIEIEKFFNEGGL